jgi:competence ComEA-like helix-hairpin-helix protein
MGLQDREYMSRRPEVRDSTYEPVRRAPNPLTWIILAIAVVAFVGVAIWLPRAPREGSLVVNINTATKEQLETVPGIGPVLASRIIADRRYDSVDDLLRVSGIGERNLDSMRPFLKTDGETQPR